MCGHTEKSPIAVVQMALSTESPHMSFKQWLSKVIGSLYRRFAVSL